MPEASETSIQHAVCEYLALKKHFFWRQNNAPAVYKGFDGEMRFRSMPKYALRGIPDVIVITDGGYAVFLEIKRKNGKQSEDQKQFQSFCSAKGAEYHIITDVSQLKEIGL